jgi:hypothetical protein
LAIAMDLMVVWSKGATATADIAPLSLPSKEAKATCVCVCVGGGGVKD